MVRLAAVVPALVLALVVTGCGRSPSAPVDRAGSWESQALPGDAGVDQQARMAASGNDVAVLLVSAEGVVQSYLSRDGAAFVPGEPVETGLSGFLRVAEPVRMADGSWLALGAGGPDHHAVTLRSTDGLRWTAERSAGIDGPVDVNDVVATPGGAVVVGDARHDGDAGGFEARAWVTADGATYAVTPLDGVPVRRGYDSESWVTQVSEAGWRCPRGDRAGRR